MGAPRFLVPLSSHGVAGRGASPCCHCGSVDGQPGRRGGTCRKLELWGGLHSVNSAKPPTSDAPARLTCPSGSPCCAKGWSCLGASLRYVHRGRNRHGSAGVAKSSDRKAVVAFGWMLAADNQDAVDTNWLKSVTIRGVASASIRGGACGSMPGSQEAAKRQAGDSTQSLQPNLASSRNPAKLDG